MKYFPVHSRRRKGNSTMLKTEPQFTQFTSPSPCEIQLAPYTFAVFDGEFIWLKMQSISGHWQCIPLSKVTFASLSTFAKNFGFQ